jgi:hypothetical protein
MEEPRRSSRDEALRPFHQKNSAAASTSMARLRCRNCTLTIKVGLMTLSRRVSQTRPPAKSPEGSIWPFMVGQVLKCRAASEPATSPP